MGAAAGLLAACSLGLFAFPAGAAAAVPAATPAADEPLTGQELAGLEIVALTVEGARALGPEAVLFYLGLEIGATLDPMALDRRMRRFWERGLLDDLMVDGERVAGGVALVVRVVERPVVSRIEYEGLQRLRASEITERLAAEGIELAAGELLRRGELPRLEAAVEALFRERGFPLVDAVAAAEEASDGRVEVVVVVDEGDRLRVGEIRFEGNVALSDGRLLRAHRESRPGGPVSRLRGRHRFDRAALARDLERVVEVYRRAGYKDAAVGEPRIELTEGEDGRLVNVTVPVEEGERWKLGGIGFSGNRRLADSRLIGLFERPSSGWLGSGFIDEGLERLRDLYGREGFMTARVETALIERPDRVADLMVRIDEGERYRVGRIEIEGNTDTREKVIRRELAVQEGQVLDTTALRRSLLRLGQLEYFELDADEPVRFSLDEEEQSVDLTLSGREADPPKLFFGGGYGSTHGLFGELRYTSRNFRGRGDTLSAQLQAGADLTQARLGYTVPWLMDRRQSLGGDLSVRRETLDAGGGESLTREVSGGRLLWGRRMGLFQSLSLGLSHRDELDSRSRLTVDGTSGFQSLDRQLSSVDLGYELDRIDSRLQPTRGLRLGAALEAAGGALGGDARYLRRRAFADWFRPLTGGRRGLILGLHLEAGDIRPLGGSELTFADRYFRGGDGSVRGFEPLAVVPRDAAGAPRVDASGFLLGGDRYLEAALELHLPIHDVLRLVAFADAGGVWAEDQSADLSALRRTAGLELRVTTPLFPQPLRFIWAENLSPLAGDRFRNFQFSLGVGF